MKFIHLQDTNENSHYINVTSIVRFEKYEKKVIIFTTDGHGLRTNMDIEEIFILINKQKDS